MDNIVRVAVIGAGGIARSVHLPSISEIPFARIEAICDLKRERAQAMADKYGIPKVYTLYEEMLAQVKPDAVFVLVRPDELYRVALTALNAGCHVFAEKPAGITLYQAQSLLRAARETDRQLQIGLNRRFIPLVQHVLETMRALGPINQVDGWFYKHGDAAFYQGCSSAFTCDAIHTLDLMRYAAQSNGACGSMLTATYNDSPVPNAWNGWIQFENGLTGTFHANYATGGRVHGLAVHGPKASAYINLGFGGEACKATVLYNVEGTFSLSAGGGGKQHIEEIDGLAIAGDDRYFRFYGYHAEDLAFLTAVRDDTPVPCGIEDALHTMELLDMLEAGAH